MQRCMQYCAAEAKFNHKVAQRDLRRYHRRGADATTRLLLAELRRWPLQDTSVLDIGGGIVVIGMELADNGVSSATVVEASPAYFDVSRSEMESRCGPRPIRFVVGDSRWPPHSLTPTSSHWVVLSVVTPMPKIHFAVRPSEPANLLP